MVTRVLSWNLCIQELCVLKFCKEKACLGRGHCKSWSLIVIFKKRIHLKSTSAEEPSWHLPGRLVIMAITDLSVPDLTILSSNPAYGSWSKRRGCVKFQLLQRVPGWLFGFKLRLYLHVLAHGLGGGGPEDFPYSCHRLRWSWRSGTKHLEMRDVTKKS